MSDGQWFVLLTTIDEMSCPDALRPYWNRIEYAKEQLTEKEHELPLSKTGGKLLFVVWLCEDLRLMDIHVVQNMSYPIHFDWGDLDV